MFRRIGSDGVVEYEQVSIAKFIRRENRFIAICLLDSEEIVVHVKNTGRCKELLRENVKVAVNYQPSTKRKTAYDLIAVEKAGQWINIDSQVPNQLAYDGITQGKIQLAHVKGKILTVKREVTYGHSRFDLSVETSLGEKVLIEVKGMTLENQKIGAFPDAPSVRALKHVQELLHARQAGYQIYLLFIVQLAAVQSATIHTKMQPELAQTIEQGMSADLNVIAYTCQVTPNTIQIKTEIPFRPNTNFIDPNKRKEEQK